MWLRHRCMGSQRGLLGLVLLLPMGSGHCRLVLVFKGVFAKHRDGISGGLRRRER